MSRYQQAPYSDSQGYNGGGGGNQYGQSYGNNGGGAGYSDEPQTGAYNDAGGYNKYGGGGNGGGEAYPMSGQNAYASSGFPAPQKKKKSKWLWIGLVILLLVIIGAVLGGVLGTKLNKKSTSSTSGTTSGNSGAVANTGVPSGVSVVASGGVQSTGANGQVYLAVATDTYMLPVYATGTATSGYGTPTTLASPASSDAWPADPSPPSKATPRSHPRLIAPKYKWDALVSGGLIANDPYLKYWNATIVANASATLSDDPLPYTEDGGLSGSGVLDVAREIKLRVKNWAYAYRVTNQTQYADRVFLELKTAAGNNTDVAFGADGTRWNPSHFLDLAEFSSAFAIGYDWCYDHWTTDQRTAIMWSIINLGLSFGYAALNGDSSASAYYWWTGRPTEINGNWNCVNNAGLTMASLAILGDDPTGIAQKVLDLSIPNAKANCFNGAYSDGTWAETANYWYFGTTGAAELVSAVTTAYGSDQGLSTANAGFQYTGLFHMYAQGMTSLFNYGDHGPNKYSATANSLLLWGSVYNDTKYTLYQRDHYDASEPWSMFWYNPAVTGTWWDGLALDKHFDNTNQSWATGRSNWADNTGSFFAMKGGLLTGHQTHGDLDIGDFVYDAMGQRWFGELGSGQYLADGYFSSEAQNSERWLYYRKRTEGQNTILIGGENQNVGAAPTYNFGSTGTSQGAAPSFNVTTTDTVFYTMDMTSAYNNTVKRGIRFLNGRKQLLIQDDISGVASGTAIQWRAHTNATVTTNGATATLVLGTKTLVASLVNAPSNATFGTAQPTRTSSDPALPTGTADADQSNDGVTVLTVDMTGGTAASLQVLLTPQWGSGFTATTPSSVAIDSWSLTSHN